MKKILLGSLICLFLLSCKKEGEIKADHITIDSKTLLDVAYGNDPLQRMDVYLPTNRTLETPVIVFIHGGSFIEGDKGDFSSMVRELVRNDFAVVNMNYRLVDGTGLDRSPVQRRNSAIKVKDQVSDVALVVDEVLKQAGSWHVSKDRVGLAGHSAGATLALLYSYDEQNTQKVKAVANLAGALDQTFIDLPYMVYYSLPRAVFEAAYRYTGYEVTAANEVHLREISPMYKANSNRKVPTLNVFPEKNDVNGLPKQDRATFDRFTQQLLQLGVPNRFVEVAGADHHFSRIGNFTTVLNETVGFFEQQLK